MQLLRAVVPLVISLAACAGSTPPPAGPGGRLAPLQLTINTDVITLGGDGAVTLEGKPFLRWMGAGFQDPAGQLVVKADPAGLLWGLGMQKHPHFASDDRLIGADGAQALVVSPDGTVTLYNGDKPVPGTLKVAGMGPGERRTAALLVVASMIRMAVLHAQDAKAHEAAPDAPATPGTAPSS